MKTINNSIEYFDWHLLFHVPLLQGMVSSHFLPSSDFAFIEPAWSLSLEWQFYLVAPLFYYGVINIKAQRNKAVWALLGSAVIISALYGKGGVGYLPKEMHLFIVGMASYYLWKIVDTPKGLLLLVACLATAIIIRSIPLFIWFSFMYIAISQNRALAIFRSILESKALEFIGKISYPMYLIHTLVIYIPLYVNSEGWIIFTIPYLIVTTLVLTILLSYLMHILIEKPGMALGRRFIHKKVANG